jgi:serine/threonine protein kinase
MASWKPFETFEIRGDTYVILSLVGEGVFGRVFETLRLLDNKIYAVKELTAYSTLPADAIRYFEQEVANLELLRGVPQVIQIVASEIIRQNIPENTGVFSSSKTSTDDRHNMLMLIVFEYAEISLSHYMHRKGKLDDPSIRKANSKVLHEECSGCVYKPVWSGPLKDDRVTIQYVWQSMVRCVLALHDKNVVHIDLKPDNFVLCRGQVTLIDLGLSKKLQYNKNVAIEDGENVGGAWLYAPPESYRGIYSTASDIWALGIILLEMGFGTDAVCRAHFEEPNPNPSGPTVKGMFVREEALFGPEDTESEWDYRECVRQCLQSDFKKRPTALQLLEHPFLTNKGRNYFKLKWFEWLESEEEEGMRQKFGDIQVVLYSYDGRTIGVINQSPSSPSSKEAWVVKYNPDDGGWSLQSLGRIKFAPRIELPIQMKTVSSSFLSDSELTDDQRHLVEDRRRFLAEEQNAPLYIPPSSANSPFSWPNQSSDDKKKNRKFDAIESQFGGLSLTRQQRDGHNRFVPPADSDDKKKNRSYRSY